MIAFMLTYVDSVNPKKPRRTYAFLLKSSLASFLSGIDIVLARIQDPSKLETELGSELFRVCQYSILCGMFGGHLLVYRGSNGGCSKKAHDDGRLPHFIDVLLLAEFNAFDVDGAF